MLSIPGPQGVDPRPGLGTVQATGQGTRQSFPQLVGNLFRNPEMAYGLDFPRAQVGPLQIFLVRLVSGFPA